MTRMQRFAHFLSYFWKNSALLVGFSVAFIAVPTALTVWGKWFWSEWSIWFWIIISINILNLSITTFQYVQYIRFNR